MAFLNSKEQSPKDETNCSLLALVLIAENNLFGASHIDIDAYFPSFLFTKSKVLFEYSMLDSIAYELKLAVGSALFFRHHAART